jgi:hypothetical protein
MSIFTSGADEIPLMTGMESKKFLFSQTEQEKWERHPSEEAIAIWKKAFLAFDFPMIVFHPAFEDYDPKFRQCYAYRRYRSLEKELQNGRGYRNHTPIVPPKAELEWYGKILDRLSAVKGSVAYVPKGFWGENGFSRPLDETEAATVLISKEEVLNKIGAELQEKLPTPDEGGLYLPYGEESGVFALFSV